jgi:hypothetical protein
MIGVEAGRLQLGQVGFVDSVKPVHTCRMVRDRIDFKRILANEGDLV